MTTTLIVSDTHINGTTSLCKPGLEKDDGGNYNLSRGQWWLWENWCKLVDLAEKAAKRDRLILVLNGDICEGDTGKRSKQLISTNRATIVRMAIETLDPLAKLASEIYVIRGTTAHVGKSAELEELIADDFGAIGPSESIHSRWNLNIEIDNVRFDIAHHVSGGGGLPWTAKNVSLKLAAMTMFQYLQCGEPIPQLVIRSHIHRMHDSYDAYPVRALITPAWQLATEYIHRIAPGALADIGAFFIHTKNGKYDVWKFNPRPQRREWVLPSKIYSPN